MGTRTRKISNQREIVSFLHCGKCVQEYEEKEAALVAAGTSRADFSKLEVGFTKIGLQIWCRRHDANVCHIDFEGQRHPANTGAKKDG